MQDETDRHNTARVGSGRAEPKGDSPGLDCIERPPYLAPDHSFLLPAGWSWQLAIYSGWTAHCTVANQQRPLCRLVTEIHFRPRKTASTIRIDDPFADGATAATAATRQGRSVRCRDDGGGWVGNESKGGKNKDRRQRRKTLSRW